MTLGRRAEAKALELLRLMGWRLLDRNWRCRWGELDLVLEKDRRLLVVEVKGAVPASVPTVEWRPSISGNGVVWPGRSVAGVPTTPRRNGSSCRWCWPWCHCRPAASACAGFLWINSAELQLVHSEFMSFPATPPENVLASTGCAMRRFSIASWRQPSCSRRIVCSKWGQDAVLSRNACWLHRRLRFTPWSWIGISWPVCSSVSMISRASP